MSDISGARKPKFDLVNSWESDDTVGFIGLVVGLEAKEAGRCDYKRGRHECDEIGIFKFKHPEHGWIDYCGNHLWIVTSTLRLLGKQR